MRQQFETDGRTCRLLEKGNGGPVLIWAVGPGGTDEMDRLEAAMDRIAPEAAYAAAVYPVQDWDRDLSPWDAPAAGDGRFGGNGQATLDWVRQRLLLQLRKRLEGNRRYYLMGYSLAGLFALWGIYETDCFQGAVCCSGSLWIDGWDQYVSKRQVKAPSDVYLSLGGREERTGNPVMARVGGRTRQQEALLRRDPHVRRCILEWNAGGHFADPVRRLAKGAAWIASVCETYAGDAFFVS